MSSITNCNSKQKKTITLIPKRLSIVLNTLPSTHFKWPDIILLLKWLWDIQGWFLEHPFYSARFSSVQASLPMIDAALVVGALVPSELTRSFVFAMTGFQKKILHPTPRLISNLILARKEADRGCGQMCSLIRHNSTFMRGAAPSESLYIPARVSHMVLHCSALISPAIIPR